MKNYFEELNKINVNEHTEQKNGLTYLSWAWAWGELKKRYPQSYYTVYENKEERNYFHDGKTAWVKTGVTLVDEDYQLELIEMLPVMDYKNKSIPLDQLTSFDVNKAIQRSLTKAVARHGLGLYIYAGEDLPEDEKTEKPENPRTATKKLVQDPKPTQAFKYTDNDLAEIKKKDKAQLLRIIVDNKWDLQKLATTLNKTLNELTESDLYTAIEKMITKLGGCY